jgi:hypothetical protein
VHLDSHDDMLVPVPALRMRRSPFVMRTSLE